MSQPWAARHQFYNRNKQLKRQRLVPLWQQPEGIAPETLTNPMQTTSHRLKLCGCSGELPRNSNLVRWRVPHSRIGARGVVAQSLPCCAKMHLSSCHGTRPATQSGLGQRPVGFARQCREHRIASCSATGAVSNGAPWLLMYCACVLRECLYVCMQPLARRRRIFAGPFVFLFPRISACRDAPCRPILV